MAETERILMAEVQANLRVIKPSRKKPRPGDVFAMQLPDETYMFGRVVGAELEPPQAPMPLSYLIYVYSERSQTMVPDLDALRPIGCCCRRCSSTVCRGPRATSRRSLTES